MWAWLAEFIGRVLRHILPALFKEMRKPTEVKPVGGSSEVRSDIDNDIANSIGMPPVGTDEPDKTS